MSLVNPAGDDNTNSGSSANAGGDPALIAQICSMGFSTEHAKFALKKNNNNGDVAVMWLFENSATVDAMIASEAAVSTTSERSRHRRSTDFSELSDEQVESLLEIHNLSLDGSRTERVNSLNEFYYGDSTSSWSSTFTFVCNGWLSIPSRLRTSIIMFICSAIANLLYSYIMSFLNLDYASLGKHLVEMEKEFVDRIGHELVYWNNNNGPCCKIS